MPRQSNRSRKKTQDDKNVYCLSVTKNLDYDLSEIIEWIQEVCNHKDVPYREYSRNTLFFFENLDDAFNFRLYWDAPRKETH